MLQRPENTPDCVVNHMSTDPAARQTTPIAAAGSKPRSPVAAPRSRRLRLFRWLPRAWVITTASARSRQLYLTFDDGPDPEHTPPLLDLLALHDAKATFFVIGQSAERHPALLRRIIDEGHALGNHSWSHPRIERLPSHERRDELDRTDRLLQAIDGRGRHDFRPPRGAVSAAMLLDCVRHGRRIAYWSYDSLDYSQRPSAELIAAMRERPVRSGDIVLMHDDSGHSLEMLRTLLPEWASAGYVFKPLPAVPDA